MDRIGQGAWIIKVKKGPIEIEVQGLALPGLKTLFNELAAKYLDK